VITDFSDVSVANTVKTQYIIKDIKLWVNNQALIEKGSIEMTPGSTVAIVGPSGCGKTSLMKALLGLGGSGIMLSCNNNVIEAWLQDPNFNLEYIPQEATIIAGSIVENITLGLEFEKSTFETVARVSEIESLITMRGSEGNLDNHSNEISGGQKQRLALARALYSRPLFVFMDEPLSGVDMKSHVKIFRNMQSRDVGVLMITHSIAIAEMCDKVYRIEDKRIKRVR